MPAHNYLFNFAASFSSGGYKRLHEYARWFDAAGGASFIIHPRCEHLRGEFSRNRYFIVRQGVLRRLFDDCGYLRAIEGAGGSPDFYYSYGIPLYHRVGRIGWFHLSNVLPMMPWSAPMSLTDRCKFALLGRRMRAGYRFADVISVESSSSIDAIGSVDAARAFVSVNGSDHELAVIAGRRAAPADPVATVVGTYRYKALGDSLRVFEMLRAANPGLELHVFGNPDWVKDEVRDAAGVRIRGTVPRGELIETLQRSRFYISTTLIENSYNAASEGVFCAEQSYVSDIGPHRELLAGMPVERVNVPGVAAALLHLRRADLDAARLKTWDEVIRDMLARYEAARQENER